MYEAVRVASGRSSTPARLASRAAQLGYDGIVIHGSFDEGQAAAMRETYDIDIVRGMWIDATGRDAAARDIAEARSAVDLVTVRPADADIQRFLAERSAVDVIVPTDGIEHTTAKVARDHGIAIAFDLGGLLRERGDARVAAIREIRRLVTIVDHFDVPYVVTEDAGSHLALRAPRELRSLGPAIEADSGFVDEGLRRWGDLAERTRRNRDDRFIEPGVRKVDDEADAG